MSIGDNRVICGDALDVLRTLPDASVHCIVTSPPYFCLRDYNVVGQLGLERTPAEYIAAMVAVFREARRVLRDDGTLWLNIGDSYASDTKGSGGATPKQSTNGDAFYEPRKYELTVPPKSLLMIPARLAIALQDDGWILRSDIIWAKSNPMPESVTDRPTRAHEYVFLFAKQGRYWYDAEAIQERAAYAGKVVTLGDKSLSRGQATGMNVTASGNGMAASVTVNEYRNARTVWMINTEPTGFSHFATMPTKLVRRCIVAGCPVGGVVLDPFFGSGTTGLVARKEGRRYLGIELNPEYVALAESRLAQEYTLPMLFDTVEEEAI